MKDYKKLLAAAAALTAIISCTSSVYATNSNTVNITVNTASERKPISPYIYGISYELIDKNVSAGAIRAGGNRFPHTIGRPTLQTQARTGSICPTDIFSATFPTTLKRHRAQLP